MSFSGITPLPILCMPRLQPNRILTPLFSSSPAVSVCVSCGTLVAISLERFYAICQPLLSRRWQTLAHSYRAIGAIWVTSLCLTLPIAVFHRLIDLQTGKHACRYTYLLTKLLIHSLNYLFTYPTSGLWVVVILPDALYVVEVNCTPTGTLNLMSLRFLSNHRQNLIQKKEEEEKDTEEKKIKWSLMFSGMFIVLSFCRVDSDQTVKLAISNFNTS